MIQDTLNQAPSQLSSMLRKEVGLAAMAFQ